MLIEQIINFNWGAWASWPNIYSYNHRRRQGGAEMGHGPPWIFTHSLLNLPNFKNFSIFRS